MNQTRVEPELWQEAAVITGPNGEPLNAATLAMLMVLRLAQEIGDGHLTKAQICDAAAEALKAADHSLTVSVAS